MAEWGFRAQNILERNPGGERGLHVLRFWRGPPEPIPITTETKENVSSTDEGLSKPEVAIWDENCSSTSDDDDSGSGESTFNDVGDQRIMIF